MRYLVLHDVDAVQKYVLATDLLREIRGASALLDGLNRRESRKLAIAHHGEPVYFGGGGAAADFADEVSANAFCKAVSELYVNETKTAHSTGVVVEYDETASENDPDGFKNKLREAHRQLRSKKAGTKRETQLLTSPFFKRCQSCGIYPVSQYDKDFPESNERFVCESCFIKRKQQRYRLKVHHLTRHISRRRSGVNSSFPKELEEIGEESKPKGYIGVIYADGNRMGDHLQQIAGKKELSSFSRIVDKAARYAIASILSEYYQGKTILPAIVPLCGGDDLIVIAPAHHALEIALKYLKGFQDCVKQKMSKEISACAGVAIAKQATPLSELFELAQDLCKSAKRRSYDMRLQNREVACLDFQVVTTPSWKSVKETRSEQLTIGDRLLTCRPYTIGEAENLINSVRELKEQKFPQSKLIGLYKSLWQGKHQAMLNYITLYARARPEQREAMKKVEEYLQGATSMIPPWKKADEQNTTAYGDLVEIYQFVEAK